MSLAANTVVRCSTSAFLSRGFRPRFLAAAPPSRFDPLAWHVHEMLFGTVAIAHSNLSTRSRIDGTCCAAEVGSRRG